MNCECRFCQTPLEHTFIDLGMSPLSNSYINTEGLNKMEPFYPLKTFVCKNCLLVQLEEFETPKDIFTDYAYFSSYSESWLKHSQDYTHMMTKRFGLSRSDLVTEIASNDGYLLQFFNKEGIPTLGIEPAKNVAQEAVKKGVRTISEFFNSTTAKKIIHKYGKSKLLLGNNVLAHVPNLNDFVAGLKIALDEKGLITMEFPHIYQLMENLQFDTIYHEHFSYFSFLTVKNIFHKHQLQIFDVEELSTHGGSLRIFACHNDNAEYKLSPQVNKLINKETAANLNSISGYSGFAKKISYLRNTLITTLTSLQNAGKSIVAYGAPAKGNTLLNYCGIKQDLIHYTVDKSPHKQGKFLPGTHIPIYPPSKIKETQPDYILLLPWNIKSELFSTLQHTKSWGCQLIVPVPTVEVIRDF